MRDMLPLLDPIPFPAIARGALDTLQVNVGYRCNQSCFHCHVNAGPTRAEEERVKALEREVRELRRANEILRKASAFFAAAELDRLTK